MSSALHARWLTTLCYGAMMSLAIGLNLLPVYLTALADAYGAGGVALTGEQLGRLGAILFAGLVVGILVTGPLADRWGAKPFALAGNALGALALLAAGFAPDYFTLSLALFVLGLGAGILDMVLSPVVAALNPERRAAAMNWLHSFYCVGAAVTILVGTLLLRAGFGWRAACLALMALPLVLFLLLAREHFPAMSTEGQRTPLRRLVRSPWFLLALAAIFLGGATELGMAQWLPAYAERELGYPAWVGGTAFLAFAIAMALGRMVVGQLDARRDSYLVMAWSCAITTGMFLVASFFPHPAVALSACVAAGFTGSALWPTMLAVTADKHPEGGATMFGALAALGNAGGIFMPWIVGFVADHRSLAWGLATSALAPALMLPLVLRLRRGR
ncbi:MAG: MFS transporter [Burkholderiales bacterium]|nr:MFS transporter [Opitutaceae bacterium]